MTNQPRYLDNGPMSSINTWHQVIEHSHRKHQGITQSLPRAGWNMLVVTMDHHRSIVPGGFLGDSSSAVLHTILRAVCCFNQRFLIVCSEEHARDETWSNMVHTHLIPKPPENCLRVLAIWRILESWQEYVELSKSLIKHVTFSASYVWLP